MRRVSTPSLRPYFPLVDKGVTTFLVDKDHPTRQLLNHRIQWPGIVRPGLIIQMFYIKFHKDSSRSELPDWDKVPDHDPNCKCTTFETGPWLGSGFVADPIWFCHRNRDDRKRRYKSWADADEAE